MVKSHDSLAKIAHQNHVSVAKLKAANNLTSDLLHIGQTLVIPAAAQVATTAPVVDATTEAVATPSTQAASVTPATPAPAATPKPVKSVAASKPAPDSAKPALDHHLYTIVEG